jgi:nucleoside-diphosphate-sugar epimerase
MDALFTTEFGKPDVIISMHGIMSLGSEENFDLGMKVNFDSTRALLEKARHSKNERGDPITFVFTSSVATYGGTLPDVVLPSTACTPEGSYGMAKLMGEMLVTEYTRRGYINGISVKLPTVVPRPGVPSRATSAFVSGIVREPLAGIEAICPIGSSIDDPLLGELGVWVAKPSTTLANIAQAKNVVSNPKLSKSSRSVQLPGFTVTVAEIIEALHKVQGQKAVDLIKFEHDETCSRVVSSWPREFDNSYALSLGFVVDKDGYEGAIQEYIKTNM